MTTVRSGDSETGPMSAMFGRGLLYVVVWSLQLVSATLISPVLAHILGPNEFGRLATAISVHQLLVVLASFGLDQALMQQRAEDGDDRVARGIVATGIALATVVTAVMFLTGPLWSPLLGFAGWSGLLVAVVLWTVPAVANQMMMGLLMSQDRFARFATVSIVSAVGSQVFGIGLILTLGGASDVYAWGGVISQYVAFGLALVFARPRLRGLFDVAATRAAFALGVPIMVTMLFDYVLNAGDRIVIQRILGPAETGRYQVAYTIGFVVVMLVGFTMGAWVPRIAAIADVRERCRVIARSRDELFKLLVPVIIGVTFAAPVLLRVMAPPSFRPESLLVVVYVVSASAFLAAASDASSRLLITERRARPVAVIVGVSATVNVALNIVLLPVMGIAGAAVATAAAYGLQAVLQRRVPGIPALDGTSRWLLVTVVGAVALAGGSTLLPQTPGWNTARFVLAVACLPWLLRQLRSARNADEPVRSGPARHGKGTRRTRPGPPAAGKEDSPA